MNRSVVAYIDKAALRHNFNVLKQYSPNTAVLAMVKSNGYGHGLLSVAKTLAAEALGVARLEEALALRVAGVKTPIVVMAGFLDQQELTLFCEHELIAVLHQAWQIDLLEKTTLAKPITAWLKIDTGMHRLGFAPATVPSVYQRLQKFPSIKAPLGLMTHLAEADQDEAFTRQQVEDFFQLTAHYAAPKSIANSAAILRYPETHADWVRPGIMLYGISPFSNRTGTDEGLKPVMTLQAKLIAYKTLKKGDAVGYGRTFTAPEDMPIGVIAIGYGDGYPRAAKNGTPVLLRNTICPLIGRVSMDMITVDLRPLPHVKIGEVATLWGEGLPAEKVAAAAGTIAYELLCDVTSRVQYVERG